MALPKTIQQQNKIVHKKEKSSASIKTTRLTENWISTTNIHGYDLLLLKNLASSSSLDYVWQNNELEHYRHLTPVFMEAAEYWASSCKQTAQTPIQFYLLYLALKRVKNKLVIKKNVEF